MFSYNLCLGFEFFSILIQVPRSDPKGLVPGAVPAAYNRTCNLSAYGAFQPIKPPDQASNKVLITVRDSTYFPQNISKHAKSDMTLSSHPCLEVCPEVLIFIGNIKF